MSTVAVTEKDERQVDGFDRMQERLAARAVEIDDELEQVRAAITDATLALQAGAGEPDAAQVKSLAAAEKRAAALEDEQRRIERAALGLGERIDAAREAAEHDRVRDLARQYLEARERLHEAQAAILAALEVIAGQVDAVHREAAASSRLALKLRWQDVRSDHGLGWLRDYAAALFTCGKRGDRAAAAARERLEAPWRRPGSILDAHLRDLDL